MPWKETCPMTERTELINSWLTGHYTVTELAKIHGVSRKSAHKWIDRFKAFGMEGVADRSRAPHHHPNATPADLIADLLAAKHQHPSWGPVTLIDWLKRKQPTRAWPAPSTAGELLKRHGLVRSRRRSGTTPPHTAPLSHATEPNAVWSADYKGQFTMGDQRRCYPLTLSDNFSRFLIACQGMHRIELDLAKATYIKAFRRHGLPVAIRTDNGAPFASTGLGGLTRLSVWLLKLRIWPERIAPGHPEQNPRHERMHRTLKAATATPPKGNLSAQQKAFNYFRTEYNHERPHRAHHGRTPAEIHRSSSRPYPERLPAITYPDLFQVRQVRHNGQIKWRGRLIYVAQLLAREPVGLKPVDDGRWELYFAAMPLGILDERIGAILRPRRPR